MTNLALVRNGDPRHNHDMIRSKVSFHAFYVDHFVPEHRHRVNVALHVFGTLASCALVPLAWWRGAPWMLVLWPVVHVAPGLLGHRLVERNTQVGDLRVTRTDFPLWWFVVANHMLTAQRIGALVGLARWPLDLRSPPPRTPS